MCFNILKIRADVYGSKLAMPNYHKFVADLKLAINAKAKPYHDKDLMPNGEPKPGARKSYVRINKKAGVEKQKGGFWFTVSGLNASTGERYVYRFDIENHDGDLFYETVNGPGVFYGFTSTLDNEQQLIIDIATEIGRIHENWEPPKVDPRETIDEMREEHEERDVDITAFGRKEQAQRDRAVEERDPSKKPDDTKTWRSRFRGWRDKIRGSPKNWGEEE